MRQEISSGFGVGVGVRGTGVKVAVGWGVGVGGSRVAVRVKVGVKVGGGVGVCAGNGLQAAIANRKTAVKTMDILFIILLLLKELPYDLVEGHFPNCFTTHRNPPFIWYFHTTSLYLLAYLPMDIDLGTKHKD